MSKTTFRVGDTVRLNSDTYAYAGVAPGGTTTVSKVLPDGDFEVCSGPGFTCQMRYWTLVSPAAPKPPVLNVGDKVRARRTYGSSSTPWYKEGDILTVSLRERDYIGFSEHPSGTFDMRWPSVQMPDGTCGFELVEDNELERLVRVANEGLVAIVQLKRDFSDKVAAYGGGGISQYFTSRIDIKPKPAFEPFYVGPHDAPVSPDRPTGEPAWLVKLEGETLHIGCQKFSASDAKAVLKSMVVGDCPCYRLVDGTQFYAYRQGVGSGPDRILSWPDADKILAALEKAGTE